MRSIVVFVLIAAALMGAGHSLLSHPEVFSSKSGLAELDATNAISERFGQNAAIMVIARAKNGTVLDAGPLAEIDSAVKQLDRSGGCKSVLSFFALPVMVVGEDQTDIQNLVDKLPTTDADRAALKKRVLAHANAVGELVSEDLTRAMLICSPLPNDAAVKEVLAYIENPTALSHISLMRVGAGAIPKRVSHDVFLGGVFFLLGLIPLLSARLIKSDGTGSFKQVLTLGALSAVMAMVSQRIMWPAEGSLGALLGSSFSKSASELAAVTRADRTTLVRVDGDFNTAAAVATLAKGCQTLGEGVACPTDVLLTLAGALTGEAKLPEKDDQLKALWFFAGDRPELSLIVAQDKQSALVRVLDNANVDPAAFAPLKVTLGGLPLVERALSALSVALWGVAGLLMFAAFALRREPWPLVVSQALILASAGMPILLFSRVLVIVGFCAAIASARRTLTP